MLSVKFYPNEYTYVGQFLGQTDGIHVDAHMGSLFFEKCIVQEGRKVEITARSQNVRDRPRETLCLTRTFFSHAERSTSREVLDRNTIGYPR